MTKVSLYGARSASLFYSASFKDALLLPRTKLVAKGLCSSLSGSSKGSRVDALPGISHSWVRYCQAILFENVFGHAAPAENF